MVAEKSPGAVKMKAGREEQPGLDPDRNKTLVRVISLPTGACLPGKLEYGVKDL